MCNSFPWIGNPQYQKMDLVGCLKIKYVTPGKGLDYSGNYKDHWLMSIVCRGWQAIQRNRFAKSPPAAAVQ